MGSVIIGFSGGVDSSLAAWVAHAILGEKMLALTVQSPVESPEETQLAIDLAKLGGFRHRVVPMDDLADPVFSANPPDRCFHCKLRRFRALPCCGAPPWDTTDFSIDANPDKLRPALERYPETPIILAHLGSYSKDEPGIWFEEACRLGADYPNVWGDLAAVAWLVEREWHIDRMRETIGLKRILFASDYPAVANQVSIGYMINLIRENPFLTEDEKLDILGRNAARLFEIE